MPRSMVGLLAAVGTAMSALAAFAHGALVWVTVADAAAATGLAAYLATAPQKIRLILIFPNGLTVRSWVAIKHRFDRRRV